MRGDCRLARYAAILRASLLLKHEYFVLCQIPEKTYKSRLPARHGSRFSWRGRVRNMQRDVGFNIIVIRIQFAAVEDFKKNRAATRIWKRLQPRTPCEHLKPDHYGNSTLSRAIPSNPLTPRRAKKKTALHSIFKALANPLGSLFPIWTRFTGWAPKLETRQKTFQILHHFGGVGAENFHTQIRAQKTTRAPQSLIFRSFPLFSAIPRFQYHLLNIIAPPFRRTPKGRNVTPSGRELGPGKVARKRRAAAGKKKDTPFAFSLPAPRYVEKLFPVGIPRGRLRSARKKNRHAGFSTRLAFGENKAIIAAQNP